VTWGELPTPSDDPPPAASEALDATAPNAARIYDAWLGGKDNFGADRRVADEVAQAAPFVVEGARANRAFLRRAVTHLTRAGVDQFLDLGSGLPTSPNVHEIAQQINRDVRVVYLDRDPVVLVHARALLANDRTIAVAGDIRDPHAVLTNPAIRTHLDLDRPIGLLLVAVAHFLTEQDKPAQIISAFRDALAPDSHLVLSHVADLGEPEQTSTVPDPSRAAATRDAARVYESLAGPFLLRTLAEIETLFDGFKLIPPGVVPAHQWRPGSRRPPREVPILAGVGRLPKEAEPARRPRRHTAGWEMMQGQSPAAKVWALRQSQPSCPQLENVTQGHP
jgi:SAM-dependent methyltransferase